MKSFLALALEVAASFSPAELRRPLLVLGTADEESSMSGARALADAGEALADRAIIGEPTGLVPIRAHKGILMERVRLQGRSGHSSDPSLGLSALDGMHAVLGRLVAYRDRIAREQRDASFDVPHPTLNLGRIHGGDAPNRICAACELAFDVRMLPGMPLDATRAEIHGEVRAAVREAGLALDVDTEPLFAGVPAFAAPPGSPWVRELEEATGRSAGTVAFGTEAPFFAQLGIETVVLGPGSIEVAHRPDEHVPLEALSQTVELLRRLVHEHCT
jgi:acetylornithine deacetylase